MAVNHLKEFVCIRCQTSHAPEPSLYTCRICGGNLDARYDYNTIGTLLTSDRLGRNPDTSLWRYAPFLPTGLDFSPLSLPVGMTPLSKALRLGQRLGMTDLWIKNDTLNPSGSFKDRASLMILAHCLENNLPIISAASTGNAGTSMACLAAAAGSRAIIFVPESAPRAKIVQLMIYGARVFLVRGDYRQAFELCETVSNRLGWFNRNTGTNPYTREGKKTVSFELWEQMGYACPDAVVVSVGDGNIISGVYKGFYDLYQANLIPKIPRIIGVQAEKSAAISNAFHGDGILRRVTATSLADSICAAFPSDGEAALAAVERSGGTFVTLSDERILDSIKTLAQTEGVFAEPSGAAGVGGIQALLDKGKIAPAERVVLIVTGSGLKDVDSAFKVTGMPGTIDPDPEQVIAAVKEV
ncbi:threonine synthase [Desulfobacula sp.]|uniref:threonine synthase n=1 Tax=Desulfobacula sp. TaxID=2593537 RepID=UPI002619374E|nr:threonine synthase [Desulfobacula sp.]